jgi:hypothetical protein
VFASLTIVPLLHCIPCLPIWFVFSGDVAVEAEGASKRLKVESDDKEEESTATSVVAAQSAPAKPAAFGAFAKGGGFGSVGKSSTGSSGGFGAIATGGGSNPWAVSLKADGGSALGSSGPFSNPLLKSGGGFGTSSGGFGGFSGFGGGSDDKGDDKASNSASFTFKKAARIGLSSGSALVDNGAAGSLFAKASATSGNGGFGAFGGDGSSSSSSAANESASKEGKSDNPFASAQPTASSAPFVKVSTGDSNEEFNNKMDKIQPRPEFKQPSAGERPNLAAAQPQTTGEENETVVFSLPSAKLYRLTKKEARPGSVVVSSSSEKGAGKNESAVSSAGGEKAAKDTASTSAEEQEKEKVRLASARAMQNEWRECGQGALRVLVPKSDGVAEEEAAGAGSKSHAGRLVMRRDQTHGLILNVSLKGLKPTAAAAQGEKAVLLTCMDFPARQGSSTSASSPHGSAEQSSSSSSSSSSPPPSAPGAPQTMAQIPVPCTYLVKTKSTDDARTFLAALKERLRAETSE